MERISRITIRVAIFFALVTLLGLLSNIIATYLTTSTFTPTAGLSLYLSVILVVVSIALGILVIFQTAREKRANKREMKGKMRFCRFCGSEFPRNAHYCPECGNEQPLSPVAPIEMSSPSYPTLVSGGQQGVVTIRINVRDEPIEIEAPDIRSAVEVLQGIQENVMKHENPLKAESQLTATNVFQGSKVPHELLTERANELMRELEEEYKKGTVMDESWPEASDVPNTKSTEE